MTMERDDGQITKVLKRCEKDWWALQDLNLGPTDYESAALTAELRALFVLLMIEDMQKAVPENVEAVLPSSSMSLYRRGTVWWSRIEIKGTVHQFTTRCRSKHEARSIESARRTELVKGLVGLSSPTFGEFSGRFINSLPGRVARQTYRFYITHWRPLYDFQPLHDCRLDRINAAVVQDFVEHRRKTVGTTTINHNLRTLRRALKLAEEWNVITKAPKIRLLAGEHQRDYVLRDETIYKFEQEPDLIAKIVPFLVDTGLRRGEVCALKWEQVNFEERWVYIPKGKSKFARRKIPLTKRAEKILRELQRYGEYVFTLQKSRKRGITGDWLSHAFHRVREKLGLPDDCVLHSTRHTFCTRLGEAGADAFAIQRLAGHSSIVISQRYVHPAAARLDAAIALLE
jgi:integrase